MNPATLLLLTGLAALIIAGGRFGLFGRGALPALLRPLAETGVGLVFVGALIGPPGLGLFSADLLDQLRPVIVIGLGWIGFLYGSHFELRLMRRYPAPFYLAAFGQALGTFALVAGGSWWMLSGWLAPGNPPLEVLNAALMLGICASGTAPAGVFQLVGRQGGQRRHAAEDLNLLRFFSAVDDLPAVVLLGVMGALFRAPAAGGVFPDSPWLWLGFSWLIGGALGLAAHWLFPTGQDVRVTSLILAGVVALGAGGAAVLSLSPLFVGVVAGAVFANLSPGKESAYALLAEREHSLYGLILLLGGMLFNFQGWLPAVLAPLFFLLRTAGKLGTGLAVCPVFLPRAGASPLIGAGMLFQGGMALAMAVSFQRTHPGFLDHQVATSIVLGVVVSDLAGPFLSDWALGRGRRP